ncbi:hypothetical protein Pa4123_50330 [Phytohabitans aurantiacus]|uniref:Lipocalin-like domain-containing protein n=1 Tax=Phytohabitans aurantiacus TaxID=3016789 RepID=A0ABQ5R0E8_9ACTN|nr:hypothetical protein Pa4123_50330 [Phytohabitans aurantiacus]
MSASSDLEASIYGIWSIHAGRTTLLGKERFSRRPRSHIEFDVSRWRLYETRRRHRFPNAGTSAGMWHVFPLSDQKALLVLTVRSYRPGRMARAAVESNYGYSGGAVIVSGALAQREREAKKMRDGEARMYFTPTLIRVDEIVMALPSSGRDTPRERWIRLSEG